MDNEVNNNSLNEVTTSSLHPWEINSRKPNPLLKMVLIAIIVSSGVATGYLINSKLGSGLMQKSKSGNPLIVKSEKIVGSTDSRTFRDQAEGVLEKGGIEGEGTHKLIRDKKRPDQNVYMTSSVVDLDPYLGKKVRVWGETNASQKAGWLMDVGKIEIL